MVLRILGVVFCLVVTSARVFATEPVRCVPLTEVIGDGIRNSDKIKLRHAEEEVAAAQAQVAKAAVLPTVKLQGALARQDTSEASGGRIDPESWPMTARLAVTQPIYAGGAEYSALRKSQIGMDVSKVESQAAQLQVARSTLSQYFQMLLAQADLQSFSELLDVSMKRAKDIKGRVAIGRIRAADAIGSEAQVATARAQVESAKINLEGTRLALKTSAGRDVDLACKPNLEGGASIKSWEEVEAKIMQRPDIVAAEMAIAFARENVSLARAGNFPGVDIGANYYLKRPEAQSSLGKWDITLSASVPLYSGGMVSAKVQEATAQQTKQELQASQLKTSALDEARQIWQVYLMSQSHLSALDQAAERSAEYYRMMARDERNALATSLESLQALNSSIDAARAVQRARLKYEESLRQILILTGDIERAAK